MRVLGIDPGLTRCGVGIVDAHPGRQVSFVHVAVVTTAPDLPLEERLLRVAAGIDELLDEHRPDCVAIERVFAQHNVRTVMGTAQVSGVALLAAARRSLPVALHTPSEVKAAITGYGQADKRQVGTMVSKILRLEAIPRPADAADALALAICHAWRQPVVAAAGPSGARSTALTPAQEAWLAAERSTGKSAVARRLAR